MDADTMALLLIVSAAPPLTGFALVFGFTSPWWRSLLGRALVTKATGLALLINISFAYRYLGDDYAYRDAVRLFVYALITVGAWMQFIALLNEKYQAYRLRRLEREREHADR